MKINNPHPMIVRNPIQFNKTDIETLEKELSNLESPHNIEIVFFESDENTSVKCEKVLGLKNLNFTTFRCFEDALRIGVETYADIIVLPEVFASASRENFKKLLRSRSPIKKHFIICNQFTIHQIVTAIKECLAKVLDSKNKDFVINRLSKISSDRTVSPDTETTKTISETELKSLLQKELEKFPAGSPDKILEKAINIIRNID